MAPAPSESSSDVIPAPVGIPETVIPAEAGIHLDRRQRLHRHLSLGASSTRRFFLPPEAELCPADTDNATLRETMREQALADGQAEVEKDWS